MDIKKIPILFIGQCKNGSNSMTHFLLSQKGFAEGETVKASCRKRVEKKDYYSNWEENDLSGAKYLIDKSLIVPNREHYRGKGDIKRNKLIYVIRNPYLGIRSHFLVALRGETCYSKFLPFVARDYINKEEILNLNFKQVCSIIERNPLKIAHTTVVPQICRIFPMKNIFFTTLEDISKDKNELKRLENFLGVKFSVYRFPHKGKTINKYDKEPELYKAGEKIFNKHSKMIFKKYIIKSEWNWLSGYFGKDLVKKYNIE
ncbi:MAG: hypothetical protein PHC71_02275 [Candidatus Omnitrophica bacterium]|nr:hypothetical protein [Candidatus Omnitrophota bacterium]